MNIQIQQYISSCFQQGKGEPDIINTLVSEKWSEEVAARAVIDRANKMPLQKVATLTELSSGGLYYQLPPERSGGILSPKKVVVSIISFIVLIIVVFLIYKVDIFSLDTTTSLIVGVVLMLYFVTYFIYGVIFKAVIMLLETRRHSLRYYFGPAGIIISDSSPVKIRSWDEYRKIKVTEGYQSTKKKNSALMSFMGIHSTPEQYTIDLQMGDRYMCSYVSALPAHLAQIKNYIIQHARQIKEE